MRVCKTFECFMKYNESVYLFDGKENGKRTSKDMILDRMTRGKVRSLTSTLISDSARDLNCKRIAMPFGVKLG